MPPEDEETPQGRSKLIVRGGGMKNVGTAFDVTGADLDVEGMEFENVHQLVTGHDIHGRWSRTKVTEGNEGTARGKGWLGGWPEMPWKRKKHSDE